MIREATITKSFFFDSAHVLERDDWNETQNRIHFGKCSHMHGHTYKLTVAVRGYIDPETGMVLNYFELNDIVKPIVEKLDHQILNDHFDHLTTAELMCHSIAEQIEARAVSMSPAGYGSMWFFEWVELQETPKTSARIYL